VDQTYREWWRILDDDVDAPAMRDFPVDLGGESPHSSGVAKLLCNARPGQSKVNKGRRIRANERVQAILGHRG
jgi:hypothetical protein